jgi:hypothetical protein
MKRLLHYYFLGAFALLTSQISQAQDYKSALGIRLSNNQAMVSNAVSFKYFLNEKTAIEGLLAFSDPLAIGGMIEIHQPLGTPGLKWYYGGGPYLAFIKEYNVTKQREDVTPNFGAQGVVGLDYKFANIPLNLSLDWKPELNIVQNINFEPAAIGLTARFTFAGRK